MLRVSQMDQEPASKMRFPLPPPSLVTPAPATKIVEGIAALCILAFMNVARMGRRRNVALYLDVRPLHQADNTVKKGVGWRRKILIFHSRAKNIILFCAQEKCSRS